MYKVAYVSGNSVDVSGALRQTVEGINQISGHIVNIVQSQSSSPSGLTIVTITIIYSV